MFKEFKEKDYNCIKELGKGSFGRVYKAIKESNQKVYAIKTIDIQKILELKMGAYVQAEIEAMDSVKDVNVMKCLQAW